MKKIFKKTLFIAIAFMFASNSMANETKDNKLDFKARGIQISNINKNKSIIDIGNLIIGQTGIVVHTYENDKRIIVSNAKVISSNKQTSTIEFFNFDSLKQDALPTTKRKPEINDIFVLNYMYDESLLIAPNYDSFQAIGQKFKQNNFIHPDVFAAQLKVKAKPFPSKKDIQKFAISESLGTIFFLIDNKIYIVDTKTFIILDTYDFPMEIKDKQMPFFSRVENIKANPLNLMAYFSENKKLGFDNYYKKILGLKK